VWDITETNDNDIDAFNENGNGEGGMAAGVEMIFGGLQAKVGSGVDKLEAIKEYIINSVGSLHDNMKEGTTSNIKWRGMLKGVVAGVMVTIFDDEGVKSTENGAIVAGGSLGIVVGVNDEEL
jgi:hypothetical protein